MENTTFDFDAVIDRRGTSCLKYDFAAERGYPEGILPFWVADMDFRAPEPVLEELQRRVAHGIFGYTDPKPEYKKTVIQWMEKHHRWSPSPEELVVTPGVVFAICTAVRAYTKPGDGILLQQPVYYPVREAILQNGRHLVDSPLILQDGHYKMDFEDMDQKMREHQVKLFLLCSPHNPVGRVWTREELLRTAELCERYDVYIVADEIHHEFVRPGHLHTVLASLSPQIAERTITCTSASKTFNLAGLQVSNIFIRNSSLRRRFCAELSASGYSQPNALGLFATEAAYKGGSAWLSALLGYLEENIRRTREFLTRELPEVRLIEPEGTYLLWLDCSAVGLTAEQLDRVIVERGNLWLDSGRIFGHAGEGFQRINMACPWSVLKNGLEHLKLALRDR